MRNQRQSGVTLPELLTVIGIAIVLAAIGVPYMAAAIANLKVRSAADELAGLFQQARLSAVRDNKFYSVIDNNALSSEVQGGCVDMNWNNACNAGEPSIEFAGEVQVVAGGAPATTMITCGSNTTACPAGYTGLNFAPEPMGAKPGFTARGLPCVGNPASVEPNWNLGGQCLTVDAGGNAVGFLYVLRYNGALGASYSAVAVTPAGRVTVWTYSGKDAGGNDKWVR